MATFGRFGFGAAAIPSGDEGNRDPTGVVARAYRALVAHASTWAWNPTQSQDAYDAVVAAAPDDATDAAPFGYAPDGLRPAASLVLSADDTDQHTSPNGGLAGTMAGSFPDGFYVPGQTRSGATAAATASASSQDGDVRALLTGIVDAEAACDARGAVMAFVASSKGSSLAAREKTDWWRYELPGLLADGGYATSINGVSMAGFEAIEADANLSASRRRHLEDALAQAGQRALDPHLSDFAAASVAPNDRKLAAAQTFVSAIFGHALLNDDDANAGGLVTAAEGARIVSEATPADAAGIGGEAIAQVDGAATYGAAASLMPVLAYLEVQSRVEQGEMPRGAASAFGDPVALMGRLDAILGIGGKATASGLADDRGEVHDVTLSNPELGVAVLEVEEPGVTAARWLVEITGRLAKPYVPPTVEGPTGLTYLDVRDEVGGNVIDETGVKDPFNVDGDDETVRLANGTGAPQLVTVRGDRDVVESSGPAAWIVGDDATFRASDGAATSVEIDGVRGNVSGSVSLVVLGEGASATVGASAQTTLLAGATATVVASGGGARLALGGSATIDLAAIAAAKGNYFFSSDDGNVVGDSMTIAMLPVRNPDGTSRDAMVLTHGTTQTEIAQTGTLSVGVTAAGEWTVDGADAGPARIGPHRTYEGPTPASPGSVGGWHEGTRPAGAGPRTLVGGLDPTTFAFEAGEGRDVVADFRADGPAPSVLDFSSDLFSSPDQALAAAIQQGGDVLIPTAGSTSVLVAHTDVHALTSANFAVH